MGTTAYVGNLSYETREEHLADLFSSRGLRVVEVRILRDRDTGEHRGTAFVTLESEDELARAIADCNRVELLGRRLRVDRALDRGAPRPAHAAGVRSGPPGRQGHDRPRWGDRPPGSECFVRGIVEGVSEDAIHRLFAAGGREVSRVNLLRDHETGALKGVAFVHLATPEDAREAVSALDGYELMGAPLRVSIAEPRERRSSPRHGPQQGRRDGFRRPSY